MKGLQSCQRADCVSERERTSERVNVNKTALEEGVVHLTFSGARPPLRAGLGIMGWSEVAALTCFAFSAPRCEGLPR